MPRTSFSTLLAGTMFAAACATGPTATTGDRLTTAEARAVSQAVLSELGFFLFGGGLTTTDRQPSLPPGLSLSEAGVPIAGRIEESGGCELGGTYSVEGTVAGELDDQAGTGAVTVDLSETFQDCGLRGPGHSYLVNGAPAITLSGTFSAGGQDRVTADFAILGGFTFQLDDGRTGTCGVDVRVELTVTPIDFTEAVTGRACAVTVDGAFVFGG